MSAARVIALDPPPRRVIGRRLTLTVFEDRFARARREVVIHIRNLPDKTAKRTAPSKHELPLLKLATSGDEASGTGCLRTNSNTLVLDGIEKAVIEPYEGSGDRIRTLASQKGSACSLPRMAGSMQ